VCQNDFPLSLAGSVQGTKPAMSESIFVGRTFGALLFDMDGTIINSVIATERVWAAWAERHGLDVVSFLPTIHGVRGIDTISRLGLPGVDPYALASCYPHIVRWRDRRR